MKGGRGRVEDSDLCMCVCLCVWHRRKREKNNRIFCLLDTYTEFICMSSRPIINVEHTLGRTWTVQASVVCDDLVLAKIYST